MQLRTQTSSAAARGARGVIPAARCVPGSRRDPCALAACARLLLAQLVPARAMAVAATPSLGLAPCSGAMGLGKIGSGMAHAQHALYACQVMGAQPALWALHGRRFCRRPCVGHKGSRCLQCLPFTTCRVAAGARALRVAPRATQEVDTITGVVFEPFQAVKVRAVCSNPVGG